MYDFVRWILLLLIFSGLFGVWLWSQYRSRSCVIINRSAVGPVKVVQKIFVDYRTGICVVESEKRTYLLAYTAAGHVSWQSLDANVDEKKEKKE